MDQLIAKFQRKRQYIIDEEVEKFKYLTDGRNPASFIRFLNDSKNNGSLDQVSRMTGVWKYLDGLKSAPSMPLVSEHYDEARGIDRGYGKSQKPEDYILSFQQFGR